MKKKVVKRLAITLVFFIPYLLGNFCDGGGGNGGDPSGAGSFVLKIKYHTASPNIGCTMSITWQGSLVSQTSSDGSSSPFTYQDNYSGTTDASGNCYSNAKTVQNLRPGTWRIRVTVGSFSTECNVSLEPGKQVSVRFAVNCPGCSTGFYYPCD